MKRYPSALLLKRYRSFEAEQVLPLRPLTLLYGKNNAGKSALVRALTLLSDAIQSDAPPALKLTDELAKGGDFIDLAWKGDAGDYSFMLGLRWDGPEPFEVRYTIDGGPERPSYVKELELKEVDKKDADGKEVKGKLLWAGIAGEKHPMEPLPPHEGKPFRFKGLMPPPDIHPWLDTLRGHLENFAGRVSCLDGTRQIPEGPFRKSGVLPSRLEANGKNALQYLVESEPLRKKVAAFYLALQPSRELRVAETSQYRREVLLPLAKKADWNIRIQETGEGMNQVLPVLVGACLAAQREDPRCFCVLEAESHLHLDAQRTLIQFLCGLLEPDPTSYFVLETHSLVFLLALQLAVKQKTVSSDQVSLAWIEQDALGRSSIRAASLDHEGYPTEKWPSRALQDDVYLAAELARFSSSPSEQGGRR